MIEVFTFIAFGFSCITAYKIVGITKELSIVKHNLDMITMITLALSDGKKVKVTKEAEDAVKKG